MLINNSELGDAAQKILDYGSDKSWIECIPIEGESGDQLNRIAAYQAKTGNRRLKQLFEFLGKDSNHAEVIAEIEARLFELYNNSRGESDPLGIIAREGVEKAT